MIGFVEGLTQVNNIPRRICWSQCISYISRTLVHKPSGKLGQFGCLTRSDFVALGSSRKFSLSWSICTSLGSSGNCDLSGFFHAKSNLSVSLFEEGSSSSPGIALYGCLLLGRPWVSSTLSWSRLQSAFLSRSVWLKDAWIPPWCPAVIRSRSTSDNCLRNLVRAPFADWSDRRLKSWMTTAGLSMIPFWRSSITLRQDWTVDCCDEISNDSCLGSDPYASLGSIVAFWDIRWDSRLYENKK